MTFAAFKEIPWNLYGRLAAAQTALTLRSPYMDNDLVALMYQAPPHTRETNETSRRLIADLSPRLAAIATDMGYGGTAPAATAVFQGCIVTPLFKAEWYYNVGMPNWARQTRPGVAAEPSWSRCFSARTRSTTIACGFTIS